jgi:hypothetical protein
MLSVAIDHVSWNWIAFMVIGPALIALMIAYPFWRTSEATLGNIAGSIIIFGTAFAMIWREHVALDRIVQGCLDQDTTCWPSPSAFTRFAIYAFIGLFQVFGLFTLSLRVEEKHRRRDYAPEWR